MNKILLISSLLASGVPGANQHHFEMVSPSDYFEATSHLINHMDEYNDFRNEEGFDNAEVMYVRPVAIKAIDDDSPTLNSYWMQGQLIKLNEGYILTGEDNEIHAYSHYDNFIFPDEGNIGFNDLGNFYSYGESVDNWELLAKPMPILTIVPNDEQYEGQMVGGDGTIYEPLAYVRDKYNKNLELLRECTVYRGKYDNKTEPLLIEQETFSVYYKFYDSNSIIFENINELLTIEVIMDFIDGYYTEMFPRDQLVEYDPEEEEHDYWLKRTGEGWIETHKKMSYLNYLIRHHMLIELGKIENLTYKETINFLKWFIKRIPSFHVVFEETANAFTGDQWDKIQTDLLNNLIVCAKISNSTSYGNLICPILGFKYYKYDFKILGISCSIRALLLQINDGYAYKTAYFDITQNGAFMQLTSLELFI